MSHNWNLDPGKRWEQGIPHHLESVKLLKEVMEIDMEYCNLSLDFRTGGDGDLGEMLAYVLDMIFERRDMNNEDRI
jgi:hypothetical protein